MLGLTFFLSNDVFQRSGRHLCKSRRTARLEEAVSAYRAALGEMTRERVPLDWAQTQNNLGLGALVIR